MDKFSFLSTPSARRATGRWTGRPGGWKISIHALREEGDADKVSSDVAEIIFLSTPSARRATSRASFQLKYLQDFYPRPPRGGRRGGVRLKDPGGVFLSTPSARRATPSSSMSTNTRRFLSTPSARRATRAFRDLKRLEKDFYPRPPRGGRPVLVAFYGSTQEFLSTPSARRATLVFCGAINASRISIHALREEGDSKNRDKSSIFKQIIQHSARI